jgi:hypothetical protein
MSEKKDKSTVNAYATVMREIKIRAECMNVAMVVPNGLPLQLIREYCFLQLRLICELIALGCIIAHRDISASRKFRKEHSAERIMNQLGRLQLDFFPLPIVLKPLTLTFSVLEFPNETTLTKSELLKLYGRCGDILHRGHLGNFFTGGRLSETNTYDEINEWKRKIISLLFNHRIMLAKTKSIIICTFDDGNHQVKVGLADWHEPTQSLA